MLNSSHKQKREQPLMRQDKDSDRMKDLIRAILLISSGTIGLYLLLVFICYYCFGAEKPWSLALETAPIIFLGIGCIGIIILTIQSLWSIYSANKIAKIIEKEKRMKGESAEIKGKELEASANV